MREMVSRSTFSCRSWDHRVGTKHRMTTRQRTRRAELFMVELIMVSAPEWESTGDYTSSDLRVGAADCPGDYEDFSPSSLSWLLFGCRYLFVVLRIDREKQEVIKGVLPVVAMLAEVEIDLCSFRQPESCILLGKRHRAVFHGLVLAEQLDFRHGFDHVGFDPHDLK